MKTELRRSEAEIAALIMTRVAVEERANTFSFNFKDGCGHQTVVSAPIQGHPELHLLFTLGVDANHVFLMVTDGDEAKLAEVVARLEDFASAHEVDLGHTLALENAYLRENGRVALLLLEPSIAGVLAEFPDELETGGRVRKCFLTMPLDASEYEMKKTRGISALLDHLQAIGRDPVAIRAQGAGL